MAYKIDGGEILEKIIAKRELGPQHTMMGYSYFGSGISRHSSWRSGEGYDRTMDRVTTYDSEIHGWRP